MNNENVYKTLAIEANRAAGAALVDFLEVQIEAAKIREVQIRFGLDSNKNERRRIKYARTDKESKAKYLEANTNDAANLTEVLELHRAVIDELQTAHDQAVRRSIIGKAAPKQ